MARRNGRKGDYLASDDYTGFIQYASKLQKDYWGNMVVSPLKRNLQEIASPLSDPYPVAFYRGPTYEKTNPCDFDVAPQFVGLTNVPTPNYPNIQILGLNPTLGQMSVGCTFRVFGDNSPDGVLLLENGSFLTTEGGSFISY